MTDLDRVVWIVRLTELEDEISQAVLTSRPSRAALARIREHQDRAGFLCRGQKYELAASHLRTALRLYLAY